MSDEIKEASCGTERSNNSSGQQPGSNSPAIASMVLGIVSFVLCWCSSGVLGIITGPVTIILAAIGMKRVSRGESPVGTQGYAISGLVLGIITTIGAIFYLVLIAIYGVAIFASLLAPSIN